MLQALRSFVVLLLLIAPAGAAEIKPFAREDMASDAVRLTEALRIATASIGAEVKDKTPDQLRKGAAAAVAAGDFAGAEKLAGAAVTAAPKDPVNWLAYANVAVKADDAKADNRYDLVTRGATAAYAAYLRSTSPDAQAAGARRARRPARAPRALAPRARRAQGLARPARRDRRAQDLRGDARRARIPHSRLQGRQRNRLRRASVSTFPSSSRARRIFPLMSRSPASSSTAISNEDQQICVEGLKHGERYAIVLRQGLPSAVGEISAELGRL